MKTILLLALSFAMISAMPATAAVAVSKVSRKAEPIPKDRDDRSGNTGGENSPGSREETYEGNERDDRDGGAYDGGGSEDENGGMIGEIFNSPVKASPLTRRIVKEDRGAVIVRRTTIQKNISETELCTSVTIEVIAKQTGKIVSSDRQESCNVVSF